MNALFSRFSSFLLLLLLLVATGCAKPVPAPVPAPPPPPTAKGEIEDLRVLPQNLNAYLQPGTADRLLMSSEQAGVRLEAFRQEWTKPWSQGGPAYPRREIASIFARFERSPGFGTGNAPHGPDFAAGLAAAANLSAYPNMIRKAVTVRSTSLRGMPTHEPRFSDPNLPGEGYPFDYLQHTALPPGTPVLVTHASRDGSWLLAESSLTFGWLPASDVAFVGESVTGAYATARLAAIIREHTALPGSEATADVGAIFPLAGAPGAGGLTVLVPVRGQGGEATLTRVTLPAGAAAAMPMPMTPRNVAAVGNQFVGQPYGWGGLDGRRDCSAMTHDLFVPFGFYLPRNSASQAGYGGTIPLGDLQNDQKEAAIIDQGVPFASLVWMKGHILVYVGQWKGRPVVLHDAWGLHTFGEGGRDGRLVLGRVVITTLRAGEEVPDVGPTHILLNRVRALTILTRPQ